MLKAWREWIVHGILLMAPLLIAFPGVFFRGEVTTPGDILFQSPPWNHYAPPGWEHPNNRIMSDVVTAFHPWYVLAKESLTNGEWPLWNPRELAGVPLLANCQSAVFYPPRLLHLFLEAHAANTAFVLFKLWLCGMMAYLCGRTIGLGIAGSRLFSIAWMLNGYNMAYASWPLPDVSAWLPVLFAGVELALQGRSRRGIFAIAAGGAMILLAGHPESAFGMSFDLGVYFVLRLILERRRGEMLRKPVGAVCLGWLLALLAAAPLWIPFVEYLDNSATFLERKEAAFQTWVTPGALVSFWAPKFYGTVLNGNFWGIACSNRHMFYPGILISFGIVLQLSRYAKKHRARTLALAITGLLCVLWVFNAPVVNTLHKLPVFSSMRCNFHIGFALFAMALLAAQGIEGWLNSPGPLRVLAWLILPATAVGAMIAWLFMLNGGYMRRLHVDSFVHQQVGLAVEIAVVCLGLLIMYRFLRWPRVFAGLFALLLAGDLLIGNGGLNPTMSREHLYPKTALTDFLLSKEQPCRIQAGTGGIASGLILPYGIEEWLGYDGLYPARIIRFMKTLGPRIWNSMEPVCSIPYYLHNPQIKTPDFPKDDAAYFERETTLDGLEVWKNKKAFPRAFLVGKVEVIENPGALFEKMANVRFDPSKTVLTESCSEENLPDTSGNCGTARVIQHAFTKVTVKAYTDAACALVLADTYYPGWNAYIDGNPAQIFPAYYAFRGVLLTPGEHIIQFRYEPWSFYLGLAISIQALCIALLIGLFHRLKPIFNNHTL